MRPMYESTAVLRAETLTFDQYLNEVPVYTDRTVFVRPKSVRMTEFYEAAKSGIHPEVVLVLSNPADYQGEKVAVYNGKEYTIVRVYQKPERDEVELTLEERTRNGA